MMKEDIAAADEAAQSGAALHRVEETLGPVMAEVTR